ncbi:hypothetical protein FIV31_02510 [Coxiella endosymbiont of Ornithodoros amblus]|uniref:hypothetical protein n=1 Tax=Coxiella endosymbiont of Ornithodoros amblus TaxID=1656166 RepID=UPI00244DDD3A|nr:hypothetical protein [Coxiella endosymbiont of Ornithodoros amblus]MBW5802517.1 hypothetical protein [Coxiella endosymbiont of Ornithodoros amblus]
MAKNKFLTHVNAKIILILVKKLRKGNPNAQEIENSIWGVVGLASSLIARPIPDEDIVALLDKFLEKENPHITKYFNERKWSR